MNIIVFSKNRACQLDCLLSSMEYFFVGLKDCNKSIIWKATTNVFLDGYKNCIQNHPSWNYKKESNFKGQVVSSISPNRKTTVFFVDDLIFLAPFCRSDKEYKAFVLNSKQVCLSLRLHPKLNYCYALSCNMKAPAFIGSELIWNWNLGDCDFGYPMSLDGHIFKTIDIGKYLHTMEYNNPNQLEGELCKEKVVNKYLVGCYREPRVINIPMNRVTNECNNRAEGGSAEKMNDDYLSGKRIDWKNLSGYVGSSVHESVQIQYINGEKAGNKIDNVVINEKKNYNSFLSIVTGTLNRCELIDTLIENTVDSFEECELVLVDGGSTDGTIAKVKKINHPRIKLIEIGHRSSYPDFMNTGIRQAKGDLICQWNDDVVLAKGDWGSIVKKIRDENIDCAVFPWKYDVFDGWTDGKWITYCDWKREMCMNYGVYRRGVFETLGLYNEVYEYYCCDGDMLYRAWKFGKKIKIFEDIGVVSDKDEKKVAIGFGEIDQKIYKLQKRSYDKKIIPESVPML